MANEFITVAEVHSRLDALAADVVAAILEVQRNYPGVDLKAFVDAATDNAQRIIDEAKYQIQQQAISTN